MSETSPTFDPERDYPPDGATTHYAGHTWTFIQETGWWAEDGTLMSRAFSATGIRLATLWSQQ